jgi:hypothetical protein
LDRVALRSEAAALVFLAPFLEALAVPAPAFGVVIAAAPPRTGSGMRRAAHRVTS